MKQLPECTDAPEVAFLLESIQGDLAYDVGANIGQSANILARQFRQVESFEPCVESFDVLRHKVPANVSARCLAVSDRDGMVLLAETENSIQSGQLTSGEGVLRWGKKMGERLLRCARLDTISTILGDPDFVKIDVEGHEVEVIRGGWHLFHEIKPRVLIEIHHADYGRIISRNMLPHYEWQQIDHGLYPEDDPLSLNHYWLFGQPKATELSLVL